MKTYVLLDDNCTKRVFLRGGLHIKLKQTYTGVEDQCFITFKLIELKTLIGVDTKQKMWPVILTKSYILLVP